LGNLIFYVDLPGKYATGDYVQICWAATNTAVSLTTIAAGTSPITPQSPSALVTVHQI
jgi:hypothetical protein